MTSLALDGRADAANPTCREIFLGFFSVGIVGFGGVLPFARRMLVDRRRWLTAPEFLDLLALCQFMPGPNIVNMSLILGSRFRGMRGAVAAFAGLMLAPMVIVLTLGSAYMRWQTVPAVHGAVTAIAAAAAGLVLATAARMALPLLRQSGRLVAALVIVATFAGMTFAGLGMLTVLAIVTPVSILLAAWRIR